MFFDVKLLGIRQNGRFAKSWLAATNPKAFRAYVKRHDLEKINVISVCDEINNEFNKNIMNSRRRIPLYLAAQLVFGTVCIFQQQVYFLYEKTNNLMCSHMAIIKEIRSVKRSSDQDTQTRKKKRKLTKPTDNATDIEKNFQELLEEEIERRVEIPVEQLNPNPHELLIRDIDWEKIEDKEQEMFGEMSVKEKQDFIDLIEGRKTMAEICHEEKEDEREIGEAQKVSSKQCEVKSLHEIAKSRKSKADKQRKCKIVLVKHNLNTADADLSIPVLRDGPIEKDTAPVLINAPGEKETTPVRDQITKIDDPILRINDNMIPNDVPVPPDPNLMEMVVLLPENDQNSNDISGRVLQSTTEVPNINSHESQNIQQQPLQGDVNLEELSKALVAEIYRPKKRKKKSCLKIDTCIKINTESFLKQYDFEDTLRCFNPRDDIVPYYKMTFKNADNLFAGPCSRLNSKHLLAICKRGINLKQTEIDASVLEDILDVVPMELDEIFPTITAQKSKKNTQKSIEKTNSKMRECTMGLNEENERNLAPCEQMMPQIEQQLPPLEIIVPEIITAAERISHEVALPVDLQKDLLTSFRKEQSQQQHSHLVTDTPTRETIRLNWGKEAVLRKLLYFWQNEVHPIHMGLICEGAERKGAACAFYSVIELSAHKYLKLNKNNETNGIYHIEMGERLMGKLSSNIN